MEDVEPFIVWLEGQGLSRDQLDAYKRYLAELARHPSLSAALRAGEEAGMPARDLTNLRQVAARLAEFQATRDAPAPASPPLEVEPRRPLEVEPKPVRAPPARDHAMDPPRRGCVCQRRHDVYLDNDFGALAKLLGGGAGLGAFLLVRLVGVLGALTLALALAGTGGTATIISICMRCSDCRRRISDLDSDERAAVRKGRGLVTLVTIGLLAGAALCGAIWWSAVKSRYHAD